MPLCVNVMCIGAVGVLEEAISAYSGSAPGWSLFKRWSVTVLYPAGWFHFSFQHSVLLLVMCTFSCCRCWVYMFVSFSLLIVLPLLNLTIWPPYGPGPSWTDLQPIELYLFPFLYLFLSAWYSCKCRPFCILTILSSIIIYLFHFLYYRYDHALFDVCVCVCVCVW